MHSQVVVDPCIFITRSLSYMTLPVHRKVPVAVDSYKSYGSYAVLLQRLQFRSMYDGRDARCPSHQTDLHSVGDFVRSQAFEHQ